jgi:hypothetical protein
VTRSPSSLTTLFCLMGGLKSGLVSRERELQWIILDLLKQAAIDAEAPLGKISASFSLP